MHFVLFVAIHLPGLIVLRCALIALLMISCAAGEPIPVCATVPELGDLVRQVGGEAVQVTVFAQPGDDPHRVDSKPSFAVTLARAELLVSIGCELEVGWLPPVIATSRNPRIAPGQRGFLEASSAVSDLLGIPTGPIDRSAGEVHPQGNPHFLLDPLNGLAVAEALRDRLGQLHPESAKVFARNCTAFRKALGIALVGEKLAAELDGAKLALLARHGKLLEFLKTQQREAELGGWLGAMQPFASAAIAADHDLYPYFARAFGLRLVELLEPKPGVPPSARHLVGVAKRMRAAGATVILATPYFDRRSIDSAAEAAGAKVAEMAHQAGSRPGTGTYLTWIDHNVRVVAAALAGR